MTTATHERIERTFPITADLTAQEFRGVSPEHFAAGLRRGKMAHSARTEVSRDIPAAHLHHGFFDYVRACWASHTGVVLTPDVVWQVLATEFGARTVANPDLYRDLYTDSGEKKTLMVQGDVNQAGRFAVDTASALLDAAPTDLLYLLPDFSTSTGLSRAAASIALMETCSPYYDYMMFACGLPAVMVVGTDDDWALLAKGWEKAAGVMDRDAGNRAWLEGCATVIDNIRKGLAGEPGVWLDMFQSERCGSGSDEEATGWLCALGFDCSNGRRNLTKNLPSGVAVADFFDLQTQDNYELHGGILGSNLVDRAGTRFAEPVFGWIASRVQPREKTELGVQVRQEITILPAGKPRAFRLSSAD